MKTSTRPVYEMSKTNVSKLKLVWDTNIAGIIFLALAAVYQVWISYCDETSVTWHVTTSIRNYVEVSWNKTWVGVFNENNPLIQTLGTTGFVFLSWLITNAPFLTADLMPDSWFYQYKIQEKKNNMIDKSKLLSAVGTVVFNLLVVNFVFLILSYPLAEWWGALSTTQPLPTFGEFALQLFFFRISEEFFNYYGHRLLHMPQFYKYHKKHHEWTAPSSIISTYCGPEEHFFANSVPVTSGPFLLKSHLLVAWVWTFLVLATTAIEHCGYHLPFLFSPEGHDYHHKTFTCWYGTMAFLDVLHGTDEPFSNTVDGERQFISCSFVPVKNSIPKKSH